MISTAILRIRCWGAMRTLIAIVCFAGCSGDAGPVGQAGANGSDGVDGFDGSNGVDGTDGVDGVDGADGIDGTLRIYGDGGAGAYTVSVNTNWVSNPPANAIDKMLMFTDFTIMPGATLTIPGGLTIRCTGTFTNGGTLAVAPSTAPSSRGPQINTGGSDRGYIPSYTGISSFPASIGDYGSNTGVRNGGPGGTGLTAFEASRVLAATREAGGAGAHGAISNLTGQRGGGGVVVLAHGAISNGLLGLIQANAQPGGINPAGSGGFGGGAGGVVVLASHVSINNAGSIEAKGGDGGPSGAGDATGGGGGGGIVHLLAPTVTSTGSMVVNGGAGGAIIGTITAGFRAGGGGGGGCGGKGGTGGNAGTTTSTAAGSGDPGHGLISTVDPAPLF